MIRAKEVKAALRAVSNKKKAELSQSFFKTGPGQYGEGDIFLGVMMLQSRAIAKEFCKLSFREIRKLLVSKIHEERLVAVLILVYNFELDDEIVRERICEFYLSNIKSINNWDLVDLSADKIVGEYLRYKPRLILKKLARSKNLWERRISIIATFQFIAKDSDFKDTIKIAEILLNDNHDLIHKAVGWMLREIGKRDQSVEERFLKKYYKAMPRTMLRYSIEKFPERLRKRYLKGLV